MREAAKTFLEILKKIAMCLSKARCHMHSEKLPRTLVYRRLGVIYSLEDCHTHLEGSMSLTAQKLPF